MFTDILRGIFLKTKSLALMEFIEKSFTVLFEPTATGKTGTFSSSTQFLGRLPALWLPSDKSNMPDSFPEFSLRISQSDLYKSV